MCRILLGYCILLFVCATSSAQEMVNPKDVEERGVFDPDVSSEAANSMVARGISSGDPDSIDIIIRALGDYATLSRYDLPSDYGQLPERSFQSVPGLKEFLISHYKKAQANDGGDSMGGILQELGSESLRTLDLDDESMEQLGLNDLNVESIEQLGDVTKLEWANLFVKIGGQLSPWRSVPNILCALWPSDNEVLDLIWYMNSSDLDPNAHVRTLALLNDGQFATHESNTCRLVHLSSSESGATAFATASLAAQGLALSHPPEALEPLIAAAGRHPIAQADLLIAISGYDDEQLKKHAVSIRPLLKSPTIPMLGQEQEARNRLQALIGGGD